MPLCQIFLLAEKKLLASKHQFLDDIFIYNLEIALCEDFLYILPEKSKITISNSQIATFHNSTKLGVILRVTRQNQ